MKTHIPVQKTIKLFIGGSFPRTESGRSFPVYYHKSKKIYAHLCKASRKDLRNAVEEARKGFQNWSSRSTYNRGQILYRMAEMMEGKRDEFVRLFKDTLGYTQEQSDQDVTEAIDALVYYAGFADKYPQVIGAVNPVSGPHHNFTTPEPMGVVGLIPSSEFSFPQLTAQMAAILCSGNALVVLLSETGASILAPLSEVLATSDLPQGVVNLLSGDREELYEHLGSHMEIQAIGCFDPKKQASIKKLGVDNMKRIFSHSKENLSLENILAFVEYKTVWHPIGY